MLRRPAGAFPFLLTSITTRGENAEYTAFQTCNTRPHPNLAAQQLSLRITAPTLFLPRAASTTPDPAHGASLFAKGLEGTPTALITELLVPNSHIQIRHRYVLTPNIPFRLHSPYTRARPPCESLNHRNKDQQALRATPRDFENTAVLTAFPGISRSMHRTAGAKPTESDAEVKGTAMHRVISRPVASLKLHPLMRRAYPSESRRSRTQCAVQVWIATAVCQFLAVAYPGLGALGA